jgi:hypothetical protein
MTDRPGEVPGEDITDPSMLLAAADAGAPLARLDKPVEDFVRLALENNSWSFLVSASRVLKLTAKAGKAHERERIATLLAEVRRAMKERSK